MSKLICPNCGVAASFSPAQIIGKGALLDKSYASYTIWGKVQISAIIPYDDDEDNYAILVCQTCRQCFVVEKKAYTDEWSAVYPIRHKRVAQEIPEPIRGEFEEAYLWGI